MPVNDCENNCTLKTRVDRLEKDFEAEKETNSQRHAEFYSRIGNCERVQAVSGTRLDTIMDKLDSIALDLTACRTSSLGSENSVERPARPTSALGPQSAEHSPEATGNISTELCVIRASIPLVRGALSTAFRRLGVVPRAE